MWLVLAGALVVAACNAAVLVAASGRVTPVGHEDEAPKRRAAVVMGCAQKLGDGRGNLYFATRIRTAAKLWRAGRVEALVVSGDNHVEGYDEPSDMKRALVAAGVPEDRIVCDYAGFRTLDSVVRAKTIFGLDSFLVVSQDFHVRRAVFLGRCHGLDVHGVAAPHPVGLDIRARNALREALARTAAVLDVIIGRRPRFGGPPVPLPCAMKDDSPTAGLASSETEAEYERKNGALPFLPSESTNRPAWRDLTPDSIAFDDIVMSSIAYCPDLVSRAAEVVDFKVAVEFDHFRRELVAAVDAGSKEQFAALVDPAMRDALSENCDRPSFFRERFFAAALTGRESKGEVPAIRLRPMLPDEEARLLASAPGVSNHLNRFFLCVAWVSDSGPFMEFPIVRGENGFLISAPMLWRFSPAEFEQVGGVPGVYGSPDYALPWRSAPADCFGSALLKALQTGDPGELPDKLCPETQTKASIEGLRQTIAFLAAILDGMPFRIRSRFPDQFAFEPHEICHRLDPSVPRSSEALGSSPARIHPGLWLAFDAIVETNGVECPLFTFFALQDKDDTVRLLAPEVRSDNEKPHPAAVELERLEMERNLRLVSSDVRFRFLGHLATSLASPAGAKPALLPRTRRILSGNPEQNDGSGIFIVPDE